MECTLSSWIPPEDMCKNLLPTRRPCSSECVIQTIARNCPLWDFTSSNRYLSTLSVVWASNAEVGSISVMIIRRGYGVFSETNHLRARSLPCPILLQLQGLFVAPHLHSNLTMFDPRVLYRFPMLLLPGLVHLNRTLDGHLYCLLFECFLGCVP